MSRQTDTPRAFSCDDNRLATTTPCDDNRSLCEGTPSGEESLFRFDDNGIAAHEPHPSVNCIRP